MADIFERGAGLLGGRILRCSTGNSQLAGSDLHQRVVGLDAVADTGLGLLLKLVDTGDFGRQRTGADQAHDPRDMHGIMSLACLLIRKAEGGKAAGAGSVSHMASIAASFIF